MTMIYTLGIWGGRNLEYDGMRVKVLRLMTWIDPRETAITWIR